MKQGYKILVTGANGYIGRRMLPFLVKDEYHIVCLVRDVRRFDVEDTLKPYLEVVEGDLLKAETLKSIPYDIDAAYFLVHSMSSSYDDFQQMEALTAKNFVNTLVNTSCQQIVFLSGIMNEATLSRHFQSRLNVEQILLQSSIPVTVLRAAIIVGSGSASFELVRDLVEKLPVMVAPKWLKNYVQPIAIRDVLKYLTGVLFQQKAYDQIFDIGGPDVLSYRNMLMKYAEIRGYRRLIINIPVLTPKLSAYWLYFVTATSFPLARTLVESLKNEVVVKKRGIEKIVPIDTISYQEAVKMAFSRIEQNIVPSSWKDAMVSSNIRPDFMDLAKIPEYGCVQDIQKIPLQQSSQNVINNIWRIGGQNGWYYMNLLWKLRGILDKMAGGVGLRRGRRSPDELVSGDALDFWRVLVSDQSKGHLLLYAEMKLPGEAWLEFKVNQENGSPYLQQKASFRPRGISGRLYWYSLFPLHFFIFRGMAHQIASKNLT